MKIYLWIYTTCRSYKEETQSSHKSRSWQWVRRCCELITQRSYCNFLTLSLAWKEKERWGNALLMMKAWRKLSGKKQSCCSSFITYTVQIPISALCTHICTHINEHLHAITLLLQGMSSHRRVLTDSMPLQHSSSPKNPISSAFLSESICMFHIN